MTTTTTIIRPAPRRSHRGRRVVIALLIVVAVLAAAAVAAEVFARQYADNYVRSSVVKGLGLPSEKLVHVDLGGGSVILQAIAGRIDRARVTVDSLTIDSLRASAVVTATGVPLDTAKPLRTLHIDATVTQASLAAVIEKNAGVAAPTVSLPGRVVRIATTLTIFGTRVPVALDLAPSASKGDLVFTPDAVILNGSRLSIAQVKAGIAGSVIGQIVSAQRLCVANALPKALTLDSVAVTSGRLVIGLQGDGAKLSAAEFATRGSCPSNG